MLLAGKPDTEVRSRDTRLQGGSGPQGYADAQQGPGPLAKADIQRGRVGTPGILGVRFVWAGAEEP